MTTADIIIRSDTNYEYKFSVQKASWHPYVRTYSKSSLWDRIVHYLYQWIGIKSHYVYLKNDEKWIRPIAKINLSNLDRIHRTVFEKSIALLYPERGNHKFSYPQHFS